MFYCFDCDVAKEYGIAEAVIIWHFQFWLIKNRANGEHFYDGQYWTYNSIKAFQELFPLMCLFYHTCIEKSSSFVG